MAQNTAHLTQNLQSKPSIFEVIAADSLQTTFYPALKRITNLLASINPEHFGWTVRFYDEIFLLLNAVVQRHYIDKYGGSLAEVFYSLTRLRKTTEKLNRSDRMLTFACLVLWPYVQAKLNAMTEKWRDDCDNPTRENVNELRRKKLAMNLITSAKAFHDCLQLIQYVAYLSDLSKSHSVVNQLIGLKLDYMQPDEAMTWSWTDLFSGKLKTTTILGGMIFRGLELSAFFLQFMQWWQNETTHGNITSLPIPEAPEIDLNERYKGICPLCLQKWKIPTANRISGYVFCYKCIVKDLEGTGQCPVSNYPSSIEDLVRIYDV